VPTTGAGAPRAAEMRGRPPSADGPPSGGARPSAATRLLAADLIDWTGTGFYLAISAIFLTREVGLTPGQVGLALAAVGIVSFAGGVHVGRLGDRHGHRETLVALHAVRAAGFAALATVPTLPLTLLLLAAIGLADQGAGSMLQALGGELAGREGRVAFMARLRTVTNIGITLGLVPAGIVLASGADLAPLLAANAVSYVAAGAIVLSLPRRDAVVPAARLRLLRPSAPTSALIGIDGLMSMWQVVLNVGLPLWILQATPVSPGLLGILYGTNTVVAVLLQTRVSRQVPTFLVAARAQRLAGLLLAGCCACLALSAFGGRVPATAALVAAVLCLTLSELLKASAAWQISFTLAPSGRAAEFFATYRLGATACQVLGPIVITAGVLALGSAGWALLGLVFVLAGLATPPLARAARARPLAPPPSERPVLTPLVATG
jgi:MFS family permease